MKQVIFILLLLTFATSSCRKDNVLNEEIIPPSQDQPKVYSEVNIFGRVIDPFNSPISNATVIIEQNEFHTDENGVFIIPKITLANTGSYIQVQKEGFFDGGTTIYANKSSIYNPVIRIAPYQESISFESQQGIEFTSTTGVRINFPSQSFIKNGSSYDGIVKVEYKWLNPANREDMRLMPGDLTGINANNQNVNLKSYGMIAVDLKDVNGNPIELNPSNKATISLPLDNGLLGSAPTNIPLWHFESDLGYWIEEGTGLLDGNRYTAQVSHFSWWNFDLPFPTSLVCLNFKYEDNTPATNLDIRLTDPDLGQISYETGGQNSLCKYFTTGNIIKMELINSCGDIYFSKEIGPFNEGSSEVNITVSPEANTIPVTITGQILDCDGNSIENGYAILDLNQNKYLLNPDPTSFELNIPICQNAPYNLIFKSFDLDKLGSGEDLVVWEGQNSINVDLKACGEILSSFISLHNTLTGEVIHIDDCVAYVNAKETFIKNEFKPDESDYVLLGINGFQTGIFKANLVATFNDPFANFSKEIENATITITSFEEVGGFIRGSGIDGDIEINFVAKRVK